MKVFSFLHPSAMAPTPAAVIISHHEMFMDVNIGQPCPIALRELSVRLEQEDISRTWSLGQCLERDWQVRSDSFLQFCRFSRSILAQFWANVDSAESPTA